MNSEHTILQQVYAAKGDSLAADRLVSQYLPFIKAEVNKFLGTIDRDDALSIGMMAFHEAVLAYDRIRGAFIPLAARAIRNRLIDFDRREQRHRGHISLDMPEGGDDGRTVQEILDTGHDPVTDLTDRTAARSEILEFSQALEAYGLSLTDISDNCPKQARTFDACHRALRYARQNPQLLQELERSGKLPLSALAKGSGVPLKTLERHRRYMVALLLAYTNGFEIIRGHLSQIAPRKEV